jgi:hypothetical protein
MTQPVAVPPVRLSGAGWLSNRVMLLAVVLEATQREPGALLADRGEEAIEFSARWIDVSEPDAPERVVLGTAVPSRAVPRKQLAGLRVVVDDAEVDLADSIAAVLSEPVAFAADHLSGLPEPARLRVQEFLAATPTAHGIALTGDLAAMLASLRDTIRAPLPGPDSGGFSAQLEDVTAIDETAFWLTGSIDEAATDRLRVVAISPEGCRAELPKGAVSFDRGQANGSATSEDGEGTPLRFHAFAELQQPSRHPQGWLVEFRLRDGRAFQELAAEPISANTQNVWDQVLERLRNTTRGGPVIREQLVPTLTALRARRVSAGLGPAPGPSRAPIVKLKVRSAQPPEGKGIVGGLVSAAVPRDRSLYAGTYSFVVRGWALSTDGKAVTVEAHDENGAVHTTIATLPQPAVPKRYQKIAGSEEAGFHFVLSSVGLPIDFTVDIEAVSSQGKRVLLGRVKGRRRQLRTAFKPAVQPILVNTMGRTGSSWFVALLAEHPQILALNPFLGYEAKLTSYWGELMRALSDPRSYMMAVQAQSRQERWWLGDERPTPLPISKPHTGMPRWLGGTNVENLAYIYQAEVDGFYRRLGQLEDRPGTRYFVEKSFSGLAPRMASELYPHGREIVLVRDFRDVACSILDYNAKRGLELWARDRFKGEREWLRYLRSVALQVLGDVRERADRSHVVRYEDLVTQPEETLIGVFSYLGLEGDRDLACSALEAVSEMAPHVQQAHRTTSTVEASVGRWKRGCPPKRRKAFSEAFDDLLPEFGYEPTRS